VIYIESRDSKGLPQAFCDEDGNIVEDIGYAPMCILEQKEIPEGYTLESAGWYAGQEMGVFIKKLTKEGLK